MIYDHIARTMQGPHRLSISILSAIYHYRLLWYYPMFYALCNEENYRALLTHHDADTEGTLFKENL